jgi:glycine cleavage system H protein
MKVPENLLYRDTHEWVNVEDVATVGISDFAQQQLGDITFVELPEIDQELSQNDEVAVVESVKAASDIYSPVSGRVVEVNEALEDRPELVNSDPYGEGWLFKVELSDESELSTLMKAEEYEAAQRSE